MPRNVTWMKLGDSDGCPEGWPDGWELAGAEDVPCAGDVWVPLGLTVGRPVTGADTPAEGLSEGAERLPSEPCPLLLPEEQAVTTHSTTEPAAAATVRRRCVFMNGQ